LVFGLKKREPSQAYTYFRKRLNADVFERINFRLRNQLRRLVGKEKDSSAMVVDSQSAKTAKKGATWF
jgi:hypothetical protein